MSKKLFSFIESLSTGPYGSTACHMQWSDLDVAVFVVGGIGGTTMVPFLYDIARNSTAPPYRRLQRVYVFFFFC
jgi:hypothetical protein